MYLFTVGCNGDSCVAEHTVGGTLCRDDTNCLCMAGWTGAACETPMCK